MNKSSFPPPPLQPLLFIETGLLLYLTGVVGARHPLAALIACFVIAFADSRIWRPVRRPLSLLPPLPLLPPLFGLLCVLLGLWAGLRAEPLRSVPLPEWLQYSLDNRKACPLTGTIRSVQGQTDDRLRIILEDVLPSMPSPVSMPEVLQAPLPGRLTLTWENPTTRPIPGQRLSADLRVRPIRGLLNEGLWDSGDYWRRQGVFFQAWLKGDKGKIRLSGTPFPGSALRERLRQRVTDTLGISGSGLIPALLFGDRFGIATPDAERVNAAGLSHSLALSGQHLAVVGLAAMLVVLLTGYAAPRLFLHMPSYTLLALLCPPLAGLYLWLGDAPPSLVRASLMLLFWCLSRLLVRRNSGALGRIMAFPDVLLLTLGSMVILDPLCLYDAGVQLSFSAVAGMALGLPWLRRLWFRGPFFISPLRILQGGISPQKILASRILYGLYMTFGSTCIAQLATLPLVLDMFGRSTLWFPLNVLWLPVLGLVVLPLAFGGLFALWIGLDALANPLLSAADLPCHALLQGLVWLEQHAGMRSFVAPRPHWTALIGFAALFIAVALRIGRKNLPPAGKRLVLAGCALLCVGPLLRLATVLSSDTVIRVLDVGQGQAIILEWPHGGRAILDGGGFASPRFDSGRDVVSPVLTANNLPYLTFIALSHPDADHLKGLHFLAANYTFNAAYTSRRDDKGERTLEPLRSILALRDIPRHTLAAGDRIPLADDLWLDVLAPLPGERASGNDGLVLRLVRRGRGLALFPGDAEAPRIRALLAGGADLSAELLVLPHHGSAGSFSPALYEAVLPRIVVSSAGAYNAYRLPSHKVCTELSRRGLPLRVTGETGEVVVRWNEDSSSEQPLLRSGAFPLLQARLDLLKPFTCISLMPDLSGAQPFSQKPQP